jgi:3-methyladenine DNA glycosylase Tag
VTNERGVLERLCLEGFQSGLSWLTILRKREILIPSGSRNTANAR